MSVRRRGSWSLVVFLDFTHCIALVEVISSSFILSSQYHSLHSGATSGSWIRSEFQWEACWATLHVTGVYEAAGRLHVFLWRFQSAA